MSVNFGENGCIRQVKEDIVFNLWIKLIIKKIQITCKLCIDLIITFELLAEKRAKGVTRLLLFLIGDWF